MSILFRRQGSLTIAQLTRAWGYELAATEDPNQVVEDFRHVLLIDIVNGRLDGSGPLRDGRRLGLRVITAENKAGFIEGHQLRGLLDPHLISWILHHILVMKEAVLDFATRHELPVPSWWIDGTSSSTGASISSKGAHPIAACPTPTPVHVARLRGRRPKKLGQVIEAISEDIRQGRLTKDALTNTLEKNLAAKYGVSRDTARKARDAVLSQSR
jgi:hypothetical protein